MMNNIIYILVKKGARNQVRGVVEDWAHQTGREDEAWDLVGEEEAMVLPVWARGLSIFANYNTSNVI
jgi:hypothetical protein